jgi:hypothetical protein
MVELESRRSAMNTPRTNRSHAKIEEPEIEPIEASKKQQKS